MPSWGTGSSFLLWLQCPAPAYSCFAVRAEYPYRQEVCFSSRSTLLSLRSKTTFMHQVLQPPRAADAWDLSYPAPSAGLRRPYKPQWGWVQANDGSRTWRRLPPGHDAMVSFRLASGVRSVRTRSALRCYKGSKGAF